MSDVAAAGQGAPRPPLIERLSGAIAIAGGLLSLATAALVVASVIGRKFFNSPINGDFELVQMATAIAIFSFLPYCQARRGNIVVDTFMTWLPRRAIDIVDAVWDIVYAGMMGLIGACMLAGVMEHYRSGQTTMLLQIIVWPALAICTGLAFLLAGVALATAAGLIRGRA
ncbi:MAG: TRAP transporter small permease [Hyphomonadaceae bacterium]|nr:TRAP transporter small permease [Hyphomonadaceae bacterium]